MTTTLDIGSGEQRTPEWFARRLGRLTGSRAKAMLATIKSGEAAARRDYRVQLACERLTGVGQEPEFINAEMQRGVDKEPEALAAYEQQSGRLWTAVSFLARTDLMAGHSPDGVAFAPDGTIEALLEIKCPKSATHLGYLTDLAGEPPSEHVPQLLHGCWVSGAREVIFVSYDDRFPPALRLYVATYRPSTETVADYDQKARAFLAEVDTVVQTCKTIEEARRDGIR